MLIVKLGNRRGFVDENSGGSSTDVWGIWNFGNVNAAVRRALGKGWLTHLLGD